MQYDVHYKFIAKWQMHKECAMAPSKLHPHIQANPKMRSD